MAARTESEPQPAFVRPDCPPRLDKAARSGPEPQYSAKGGARRDDGGSGSIDYAAADSEYSTGRAFAFAFDSTDRSLRSDGLTLGFGYAFVAFSNVLFQGLLNMHALLDNPFGEHPAKFPLRAYVAQLIGVTNALAAGAHDAPGDAAWVRALR